MMRLKPVENRKDRSISSIKIKRSQRQPGLMLAEKPTSLIRSTAAGQATPAEIATQWWQSGKNLDFCLLAVCSCVLAVLCHQAVQMPTGTASASQIATSSRVFPTQLDFLVKAGFFTTSNQQSEEEEVSE